MRRLFIVCFSLANLCYLRVWSELLTPRPQDMFYRKHGPLPFQLVAAMCGVMLLAALLFVISISLRNAAAWIKSVWYILLTIVIANSMRALIAPYAPVFRSGLFRILSPALALGLALVAFVCFCSVVFRYSAQVGRAGAMIATLVAPFIFITYGESALQIIRSNREDLSEQSNAPRLPAQPGTRMVWIIFDELDYRLSFVNRPASVAMPNFDRLCAQGLCASNAYPPADSTAISIPALIYGRDVKSTRPISDNRLRMEFADGSTLRFGKPPNIFSRARELGLNTAVVGWYLPYCRTLSDSLTDCWWSPMERYEGWMGDTFTAALVRQPRSFLESSVFSLFGQSLVSRTHAAVFTESLKRAEGMASDPALGLVLIHFNIPHAPFFYDQRTGKFDRANSLTGYEDALALVDRAFGELRNVMEKTGVWTHTSVLVSADHWFRSSPEINGRRDHRVPFLLHLAQDDKAARFELEFHTVSSADLILAILKGEVQENSQAAAWMSQRSSHIFTEQVELSNHSTP